MQVLPNDDRWTIISKAFRSTMSDIHITNDTPHITSIIDIEGNVSTSKNTLLLWHGTKEQHIKSIVKEGLQLPNGHGRDLMFGPGIYLTNIASKAMQFSDNNNTDGCILLCELNIDHSIMVEKKSAISKPIFNNKSQDTPISEPLPIFGIGNRYPTKLLSVPTNNCNQSHTIYHGPIVMDHTKHSQLKFDEYVLFNPSHVCVKYIVRYSS